jgi:voltage-gated potassium channel
MSHRQRRTLRAILFEILEPYRGGEGATRASAVVDVVVMVAILLACAVAVLQHFDPGRRELYRQVELFFSVLFVAEYLLRWYAAPNRLLYPFTPLALLDLLAIVPPLVALNAESMALRSLRLLRALRFLRLLQLVRLLRLLRYGHLFGVGLARLRIEWSAFNDQYRLHSIGRLALWIVVAWAVFANLLHVTEVAEVGAQGPYGDYWGSYWSIIVLLISGLEDKEPLTTLGRAEVLALMIGGICAVSMLTGEIVSAIVRRSERHGRVTLKPPRARFTNHLLILGANEHLDEILRQLHHALQNRYPVLIVSPAAEELRVTGARIYSSVYALAGDPVQSHVLEAAGAESALRVIVLAPAKETDDARRDARTLMAVLAVLNRNPSVPIVAEVLTAEGLQQVAVLTTVEVVQSGRYAARMISAAVLQPGIADILEQLMEFDPRDCEFYLIPVPRELKGKTLQDAQRFFLERDVEPVVIVGLSERPVQTPDPHLALAPRGDAPAAKQPLGEQHQLVALAYARPNVVEDEREELWSGRILSRN